MDDQAPESSTLAAGAAGAGAMLVGVTAWLIVRQRRLTRLAQELADAEAAARPTSNSEPEDGAGRSGGSTTSPARARAPLRLDIEADGGASLLRAAAADDFPAAPLSSKRLRPPPASTTPRMSASGEPSPETERHQPMEFATGEHEYEGPPPVIVVARDPNAASLEPQKTGDKGSHPAPGHQVHRKRDRTATVRRGQLTRSPSPSARGAKKSAQPLLRPRLQLQWRLGQASGCCSRSLPRRRRRDSRSRSRHRHCSRSSSSSSSSSSHHHRTRHRPRSCPKRRCLWRSGKRLMP